MASGSDLHRIRYIDELMPHTQCGRQVLTQCLNTIALRRMMAACEIYRIALVREMYGLLRDLTTQINSRTRCNRISERILRCTRAPGNAIQQLAAVANDQRCAPQLLFNR